MQFFPIDHGMMGEQSDILMNTLISDSDIPLLLGNEPFDDPAVANCVWTYANVGTVIAIFQLIFPTFYIIKAFILKN